jgi:hypothetical protein
VDRLSAGISRFHVEISTGVTLLMFQSRTKLQVESQFDVKEEKGREEEK